MKLRSRLTVVITATLLLTGSLLTTSPAHATGEWPHPGTFGAAGEWTLMQHPTNVLSRSMVYHYDNQHGRVREWNTGGINNGDFVAVMVTRLPTVEQARQAFLGQIDGVRTGHTSEYRDGQGRNHALAGTIGPDWATFQSTYGWGYLVALHDMLSGGTVWNGFMVDGIAQHGHYVVKASRFSFTQPNPRDAFPAADLTNMARQYAANPPPGIPLNTDYFGPAQPPVAPPVSTPSPRPLPRALRAPTTTLTQIARQLRRPYNRIHPRTRHLKRLPRAMRNSIRVHGFGTPRAQRVYLRRANHCAVARGASRGGTWRPTTCPNVNWKRITPSGLR